MPQSFNCGNESPIPVNKTKDLGNKLGRTSNTNSLAPFALAIGHRPKHATNMARTRTCNGSTHNSKLYIKHMSPAASVHTNEPRGGGLEGKRAINGQLLDMRRAQTKLKTGRGFSYSSFSLSFSFPLFNFA